MCIKFICEFCGREHEGTYGSGRFCSSICKNKYIEKLKPFCDYGCGQEAKHQFKNGKWCCSFDVHSCPSMKSRNSKSQKTDYMKNSNHVCDYGCGQFAHYQFKNGKYCCSQIISQCPVIKEKNRNATKEVKESRKYIKNSGHFCEYCKGKAHYHFENGTWCCSPYWMKCPAIKEKNSKRMEKMNKESNPNANGLSEEHKRKIGLANLGKTNGQVPWNKGLTKETDERIKKSSQDLTGRKFSDETKKKLSASRINAIRGKPRTWLISQEKPSSLEKEMLRIIEQNQLPFKYVGDGSFWVTAKGKHMNPDFIHKNKNKKIAIEVFCSYFKILNNGKVENYIKERTELLNDIFWKSIFLEGANGKFKKSDEEIVEIINKNLES